MKAVMPSFSRPRALAISEVGWRVIPSVPSNPMMVVTPEPTMSSIRISGARVAGPPSPPPPRGWTCESTIPGSTKRSDASISSISIPEVEIVPGSETATMCSPAVKMSWSPSGSGEKTVPFRIRVSFIATSVERP